MFKIQYLGSATAIIEIDSFLFMTDPAFSPPGDYPLGSIVLTKTSAPLEGSFRRPDMILLSHDQHPDNFDPAGREMSSNVSRILTTKAGAARLKGNAVGLDPWSSVEVKTRAGRSLKITATPARHGPAGIEKISGDVTGFIITDTDSKKDLVYITGDTCWFDGIQKVAERFNPQVILLFTGAAQVRGPFNLTMNTNDAIEAASYFKDSLIFPIHHEGWKHFTQSQEDLQAAFQVLGLQDRLIRVSPGIDMIFNK